MCVYRYLPYIHIQESTRKEHFGDTHDSEIVNGVEDSKHACSSIGDDTNYLS